MPRRDPLILFILALAVNFTVAAFVHEPRYSDDSYYFGGALRLVAGAGFTEPYFWNYVGAPNALPQPSHLYWMPLTSILAAVSMTLLGHNFAAARLPLVLAASLLPVGAYLIGWNIDHRRRHALSAGLLTVFCGYYVGYWATTDSFAVFGVSTSASLLALGLMIERNDWRLALGAGVGAGLAHLARADGLLVVWVGFLICLWRWRKSSNPIGQIGLLLSGYAIVMLPWFVRNTWAVGSPLGGGGLNTIWLVEYNDLFRYPNELTAARYFAAGWPIILQSKWEAIVINLQHILGEQMLIFLAPLIVIGLWQLRHRPLYQPVWLYALGLYAAMTLVFTFPGPRGGLFHSGAALLPAYMAAALVGLDSAVNWIAVRRKDWRADIAKRNFSGMAVVLATGLTLTLTTSIVSQWNGSGDLFRQIVADLPSAAVVMSNNPPGVWVATDHSGIPLVAGDVTELLAAADRYSVAYVLLDQNHTLGLEELYQTESAERLRLVKKVGAWKVFEVVR